MKQSQLCERYFQPVFEELSQFTSPEDFVMDKYKKSVTDRFECMINHNYTWESFRSHILKLVQQKLAEDGIHMSIQYLQVALYRWKKETFDLLGEWAWVLKCTMKRFNSWKERIKSLFRKKQKDNDRQNRYSTFVTMFESTPLKDDSDILEFKNQELDGGRVKRDRQTVPQGHWSCIMTEMFKLNKRDRHRFNKVKTLSNELDQDFDEFLKSFDCE